METKLYQQVLAAEMVGKDVSEVCCKLLRDSSSHNHGSGEWVPPRLVSFHLK